MVLDWGQNFVSIQYLENKLMEFDKILHMHWYIQEWGWDYYMLIFAIFLTELWPLIDVRILFPLSILRTNWWNLAKFCICIDIDNI